MNLLSFALNPNRRAAQRRGPAGAQGKHQQHRRDRSRPLRLRLHCTAAGRRALALGGSFLLLNQCDRVDSCPVAVLCEHRLSNALHRLYCVYDRCLSAVWRSDEHGPNGRHRYDNRRRLRARKEPVRCDHIIWSSLKAEKSVGVLLRARRRACVLSGPESGDKLCRKIPPIRRSTQAKYPLRA